MMVITNGASVKTLKFYYDAEGRPFCFDLDGEIYFYITNLQGDIVAIANQYGEGARYEYDAWGKILSISCATGSFEVAAYANPLRYRGYIYDNETGFYYLQSRYYDPVVGRFINADNLIAPENPLGNNTFAYCCNNPVNYKDSTGHWVETVFDLLSLGVSVVDVVINPLDPWAWAGLTGDALDLIPFLTGVGESVKGIRIVVKGADLADDTLTTIRFAKAASYSDEFAEGGLDLVRALDKTSDGFTISNRLDGIKIHKSFMRNGMKIPGSRLRVDGLDSVAKQLYELKPNNRNSLKKGVKQIINYNDELGGGYQMILVFY